MIGRNFKFFCYCMLGIVMICLFIRLYYEIIILSRYPDLNYNKIKHVTHPGYLIHTDGCRILDLDPYNSQVIKFIRKQEPLRCNEDRPLLVRSNLTSIFIDTSSLSAYNISDLSELHCCYGVLCSDKRHCRITCNQPLKTSSTIKDEYIMVKCKVKGGVIFKHYYAFVQIKNHVQKSSHTSAQSQKFNVLIVGMDAVSRLNFHRQLPKTVKLLNDLGVIELFGYNKVADETFPNLLSLLTGINKDNLNYKCPKLDDCPWIWKDFKREGFVTGYGEDATSLSMFIYNGHYISKKPTDFELISFMYKIETLIGHRHIFSSKLCLGPEMSIEVLYDYVKKFAIGLPLKLKFGFFWSTSLTHDDLNFASLADDLHVDFLKTLNATSTLDNTIVILLSDHGLRNRKIREVYQGYLEDRLPYVFFLLPKSFKMSYPEAVANLQNNTCRLTTAFDMHETLLDLTNPKKLHNEIIRKRTKELELEESKPIAISLFLPIHESRTCVDAGIHIQWCTCHNSTAISTKNPSVKKMSLILLDHINSKLTFFEMCSVLSLGEVRSARIEHNPENKSLLKRTIQRNVKYYVITIRTVPGDGLFEGLVLHNMALNSYHVLGDVSRINRYDNQSACIYDYHIKSYCYCTSQ